MHESHLSYDVRLHQFWSQTKIGQSLKLNRNVEWILFDRQDDSPELMARY